MSTREPGRELNDTSAAVLAYLSGGPQSGWDIARGLQALIGEFWNVTTSQVYRELQSLAGDGYVSAGSAGARSRRPYTITDDGRAALEHWLDEPPARDIVRIPLLLKMFLLLKLRPNSDAQPEFVTAYQTEHAERLARYDAALAELESQHVPDAQILRYGVYHERAVLAWIDSLSPADGRRPRPKKRPRR